MRYLCSCRTEKRGLVDRSQSGEFKKIFTDIFRHVAECGDCCNLALACEHYGVDGANYTITLTDDDGIREYNREFRDIDRPTDVLSFPASDFREGEVVISVDNVNPDSNFLELGDVVISVPRLIAQAEEYGHSVRREAAFLICHALLHLLGYDHMTEQDEARMMSLTEDVLGALGYTRN